MTGLRFSKMHGAGNDFVVIDLRDGTAPPTPELAAQLAINPNTIQRAYRELEAEGYIVSVPGRGSFVTAREAENDPHRAELLRTLRETARELMWLGMSAEEIRTEIGGDTDEYD